jgi:5'(3')-deoxyribonucleotidase
MKPPSSNQHKPVILLDMDGVLADFFTGVFRLHGLSLSQIPNDYPKPWPYKIEDWVAKLLGYPYTTEDLWEDIDSTHGFWFDLPMYPWAVELLNMCLDVSKGNVIVSTSPGLHPGCYEQKVRWLRHNLPALPKANIMLGKHKFMMAKPEHLLIDDCAENVIDFMMCGGSAMQFPQNWNYSWAAAKDRMKYVKAGLDFYWKIGSPSGEKVLITEGMVA